MNPFLINNYISSDYFCNREKETIKLIQNINNQSNTSLFAQRRLGKSALIHHVFHQLKQNQTVCIYLDIFATQDLNEFASQLSNAIIRAFPSEKKIGKRFIDTIKLLRPIITFNELSGIPEVTLDLSRPEQVSQSIPQILHFLDNQAVPIVVAIDEFQQIIHYPEKNVEAILRTVIQQLKHVNFIFCGSDQQLMSLIFNDNKRPFYASTTHLNLSKIASEDYSSFIQQHFSKGKFEIEQSAIEFILTITCNHTYYTQRLCHELYKINQRKINREAVLRALLNILQENENVYFQYRNLLTNFQWKLLIAIAKEEQVEQPYAQKFITTYKLATPANVKRSLDALLEKGMIYQHITEQGQYYEVQDKFLMRWLYYLATIPTT